MSIKKFDFESEQFLKDSPERQKYYLENCEKVITEDDFVKTVASWPAKELHNSKSRGASVSRMHYKHLIKTYGFFKGQKVKQ